MGKLIFVLAIVSMVYVIYDVWTSNRRLNETQKLIWTLAAVFASIITAVVYFFAFKRENK